VNNKAIPHPSTGSSTDHMHAGRRAEGPVSLECRCFIVVRWQPVWGSDEDQPIYSKCPIHADGIDTEGYGEDKGFIKRMREKSWRKK